MMKLDKSESKCHGCSPLHDFRSEVSNRVRRCSALPVFGRSASASTVAHHGLRNNGICDEGSGTINGVMLIAVAAVLLSAIALGGNLLVCISQARSAADQAAIAGASSARDGDFDPCIKSRLASTLNKAAVITCTVDEEDVTVNVAVKTAVPFVPTVARMARAGPVECS
ncbi:Rv3654c family TadE-like protein [Bifidobacterium sp. ESL0784]|uniref:Rv3654c family TadE-like protein n=1 Tax=Bifidobacterium sp. ESL0784 TaxID=2983231 RepID=UPI0032AE9EB6